MPESMILRFRDLAGPIGSTISRHKQIIASAGSVWWAWWWKPNEKVPRNLFAGFKQEISQKGHLDVYLADSGRYSLYKAQLVEIQESGTEEPIGSPDITRTPEYYRSTPYKAWFRLTAIEEIETRMVEAELRRWSYDEIPEFTEDPFVSSYQDKQIFSIQELLHRSHRTIYFVQPYKSEHRTHLVETLPGPHPRNFMTEPIIAKSSYLLHLSDLHFGPEHGFADIAGIPGQRMLARLIIDDVLANLKLGSPAGVIVTGDLTWQAKEEEFDLALAFIERLKSEFGLESYCFIVIPGNHDIRWVDDPSNKAAAVKFSGDEAKKNFRQFYLKLFRIPPNRFFSQGRRYLLANFQTVDVIGISSSELEQQHFAGYGYVTVDQLQAAIKEMGWPEQKLSTPYRFLALHHHLIPVIPEEEIKNYDKNYSITLDAGHVIYECLTVGVDMVLHGHQHQPFTAALSRSRTNGPFKPERTLIVNAGGSAGVKKGHIPSGRNAYTIYEINQDMVEIRVRRISDARIGFEDAPEWSSRLKRNPFGGLVLTSE